MSNDDPSDRVLLDPDGAAPLLVPRSLMRRAAAAADIAETTAVRLLSGLPSRSGTRERLAEAFASLGVGFAAERLRSMVQRPAVSTGHGVAPGALVATGKVTHAEREPADGDDAA